MVAIDVGEEDQMPPVVASVNGVVAEIHTLLIPLIAAGAGETLTVVKTVQPVPTE